MTRALIALGFELGFSALAFGWRSLVQWRRRGSTGFVRPRTGTAPVELMGSVAFVLALMLLVVAPIADLSGFDRIGRLDTAAAAIAGAALGVAGTVLTVAAQLRMGDAWRIGVDPHERTQLVTAGIFAYIRNPIFSTMVLAAAGLVLLVPNSIAIAALVVLVVGVLIQIRVVEEPYLRISHGHDYEVYVQRTGRFVPQFHTSRSQPDDLPTTHRN